MLTEVSPPEVTREGRDIAEIPAGTIVRVIAKRTLVVGRRNRASTRKGNPTVARVLDPVGQYGCKTLVVKHTVEGVGDTTCAPWDVIIGDTVTDVDWTPFS